MRHPQHIAPDLTVRQVATAWPACADVLKGYAGVRDDGRWSLQELGPIADDLELSREEFLKRLAEAAGVSVGHTAKPARGSSPVPLIFVALAICVSLGAGWGVTLLLRIAWGIDYGAVSGPSVHVHGVAQLWGWMALFVFAVATHLLRQNTVRPSPRVLEYVAAGLITTSLLTFFAGLAGPVRRAIPAIDVIASAELAGAALLFGIALLWSLSGRARSQHSHGFIFLIAWLWIWAGSDLYLRIHYLDFPLLPDSARRLLIVLPVLGFATNAIYGFGIRLIPGLLNISGSRQRFFSAALLLHNVGLVLLLLPPRVFQVAGAAIMLCGSLLYLSGMNWLRSKPARPIYGVDVRGNVVVRIAFFWLVVGLLMILVEQLRPGLPHAYGGAWRHALTVGFITTMILGVGHRIVPVFIRQPLASPGMMLASSGLLVVGNAGRVGLELATMGGQPWTFRLMGATGVLELSALLLFAVNLAMTVRRRHHVYSAEEPLTPNVRVREAINARPTIQHRLHDLGITMLDEAAFVAPSLTIGALALGWGLRPRELVAALNAGGTERATTETERTGYA